MQACGWLTLLAPDRAPPAGKRPDFSRMVTGKECREPQRPAGEATVSPHCMKQIPKKSKS